METRASSPNTGRQMDEHEDEGQSPQLCIVQVRSLPSGSSTAEPRSGPRLTQVIAYEPERAGNAQRQRRSAR
jgi:hypothetical protein